MGGPVATRTVDLERWSPTLFLAAGLVLAVYAILTGLWAFADMPTRESGVQVGYVLGFLGLLGLYQALVPQRQWLARAGAIGALFGIVGIAAISLSELASLIGVISGTPPLWWLVVTLALVGFMLGYIAIGSEILLTETYSRTVGILVAIPGIIVVLMLAHIAAGLATETTAFVISAGEALAHLAIGATLGSRTEETTDEERTDATGSEVIVHD